MHVFLHFLAKLSKAGMSYSVHPPESARNSDEWWNLLSVCLASWDSHLFLADKRALIWRSQDAGVSDSVVTGLVYRNHSFLLSCLTPSLLFRCWGPWGNPPIGGCLSSSSHIFSVVQWIQISSSPPVFFLTGAARNHSLKRPKARLSVTFQLVFSTAWKSPDADLLLAVKHIQMYSMMPLCCNWKMPARRTKALKGSCIPAEGPQSKWQKTWTWI